jgi:hypothetical protein
MKTNTLRLAALALFVTAAPMVRAAIPPAENLLPSDTLAFFEVPDCAAARVAARTSAGWMFWNDPAMKAFRDKLVAKWTSQFVKPLERDLGVKAGDFLDLPQGQFTLAVTVNGSNGHDDIPAGLLLLLDAKDKSDSLKTNLAALVKTWTDAGRALRTEEFHGLKFTVVPLSSNDFAGIFPKKTPAAQEPEKPSKPGEIYFTQYQSLLVAGNSHKVVEPVAAHLTGGAVPAIADNPLFQADKLSQFRDHPEYYGWFNGKGFFDLVSQAQDAESTDDSLSPAPKMSSAKVLTVLGLNGMKSGTFVFRDSREGATLTLHIAAPESGRTGLLKILALSPKDASVPPFVPADAVKFTRVRLDGKQTWAEIQKMIVGMSPAGQSSLNAVIGIANSIGQQKNPAFDIRTDFFGNLNDDIITYQKPASGTLAALSSPPTIFLVAVSNPDAVINSIRTLVSISNPQAGAAAPRDFLGRKIYSISLKAAPAAPNAIPETRSLYISSSGGYLAMSIDSAMVEEFLRNAEGQNKSLRDDPALLAALQHLGGAGGGMFGYENQRETMRGTFKVIKNTVEDDAALKMVPPAFREWLDFTLLPDFDSVAKYFYISTFVGGANSEGLTFKAFTPRPPQMN